MAQGLLGAVFALGILAVSYHFLAPHLQPLVSLTLGLPQLHFLPPTPSSASLLVGTLLGGIGGVLARGPREPGRDGLA